MVQIADNKKFVDYLLILLKWREFIVKIVLIACILTIVILFLIPEKYTAVATIMPPSSEPDMFGLLSNFGVTSSLSRLSQLGGLSGLSTPSDLYAAIINSDRIYGEIIARFELKKVFKTKTMDATVKQLAQMVKTKVSPVGIISVSVTHTDKKLAADIANAFVEELDKFNKQTNMTMGKKYRIFVEQRLKETQDSLTKAEEALRKFQEQHRTVAIDTEIKNAIETIVKLKSEIILREVQKGAVASASGFNNPYVTNIDQELRELKRQLAKIEFGSKDTTRKEFGVGFSVPFAKLPELSLEYARLIRDVKIQEVVFELLTQQYEQAKIMEAKDTPTVQILDMAYPPERKSYPKRVQTLIMVLILSLIFSIGYSYIFENISNLKQKSQEYSKWLLFATVIKADVVGIITRIYRTLVAIFTRQQK